MRCAGRQWRKGFFHCRLRSQLKLRSLGLAERATSLIFFLQRPPSASAPGRRPSTRDSAHPLARSLSPCFPPFCPLSVRGSRETKRPSFLASVNSSPTITERAGIEDSIHSVCLVGVHSFPSDSDRFKAFTSSHSPGPRPLAIPHFNIS